ncbi:response regulator transcription factor [Rubneribacter sp.]
MTAKLGSVDASMGRATRGPSEAAPNEASALASPETPRYSVRMGTSPDTARADRSSPAAFTLAAVCGGALLSWLAVHTSSSALLFLSDSPPLAFNDAVVAISLLTAAGRMVSALFHRRLDGLLAKRSALVATALIAATGSPIAALSGFASSYPQVVAVFFLGMAVSMLFGAVVLMSAWIGLLSRLDEGSVMLAVSLAGSLSPMCFFMLMLLPRAAVLIAETLLPLLALACLLIARAGPSSKADARTVLEKPEMSRPAPRRRTALWVALPVGVLYFGLVGQVVRATAWAGGAEAYPGTFSVYHEVGLLLAAVALCLYAAFLRQTGRRHRTSIRDVVPFMLMAAGMMLPALVGPSLMVLTDLVVGVGLGALEMQLFFYAALLVRERGWSPFSSLCYAYVPLELAAGIGAAVLPIGSGLVDQGVVSWEQISIVSIFAFFVVILATFLPFLLNQDKLFCAADAAAGRRGPLATAARTEASLDRAFEPYGLTAREREVAVLLLRGRSLPYIQEELRISSGTAKTHCMHIYQKCEVHSKQELLDLFELPADEG